MIVRNTQAQHWVVDNGFNAQDMTWPSKYLTTGLRLERQR